MDRTRAPRDQAAQVAQSRGLQPGRYRKHLQSTAAAACTIRTAADPVRLQGLDFSRHIPDTQLRAMSFLDHFVHDIDILHRVDRRRRYQHCVTAPRSGEHLCGCCEHRGDRTSVSQRREASTE